MSDYSHPNDPRRHHTSDTAQTAAVQTEPPSPAHSRGPWTPSAVALLVLIMLLSGAIGGFVGSRKTTGGDTGSGINAGQSASTLPKIDKSQTAPTELFAKVAERVSPSVVSISVQQSMGAEEGSGVILNADGTILTNNHVVAGGATGSGRIKVKFNDGKSADATIVGRDPSSDLAVIKAQNASDLRAATLGSSSSLHVGDSVLAIGSPLGLDGTVTAGIVSSLHRSVDLGGGGQNPFAPPSRGNDSLLDAIQTDAAINPGNSGGALVNMAGEVVGINTAIASLGSGAFGGQSGNIGVGFAIPIDEARNIAEQLASGQTPRRAVLGVNISQSSEGVFVAGVAAGSPAEKAGIKPDDIITKIDGTEVKTENALIVKIRSHKPGDRVKITFVRNGETHDVDVELASATP